MKSSQQAKLGEKTKYRESIEYLARFATTLEQSSYSEIYGFIISEDEHKNLPIHIRRILHGARG